MTRKLYLGDPYRTTFEGRIGQVSIEMQIQGTLVA